MTVELQAQLSAGAHLLHEAREIIDSHVADLLIEAEKAVARYDGLPVSFNPLRIRQLDGSELMHSRLLGWLLDPGGSHGLGEALLRGLLSHSRRPVAVELAQRSSGVRAGSADSPSS